MTGTNMDPLPAKHVKLTFKIRIRLVYVCRSPQNDFLDIFVIKMKKLMQARS